MKTALIGNTLSVVYGRERQKENLKARLRAKIKGIRLTDLFKLYSSQGESSRYNADILVDFIADRMLELGQNRVNYSVLFEHVSTFTGLPLQINGRTIPVQALTPSDLWGFLKHKRPARACVKAAMNRLVEEKKHRANQKYLSGAHKAFPFRAYKDLYKRHAFVPNSGKSLEVDQAINPVHVDYLLKRGVPVSPGGTKFQEIFDIPGSGTVFVSPVKSARYPEGEVNRSNIIPDRLSWMVRFPNLSMPTQQVISFEMTVTAETINARKGVVRKPALAVLLGARPSEAAKFAGFNDSFYRAHVYRDKGGVRQVARKTDWEGLHVFSFSNGGPHKPPHIVFGLCDANTRMMVYEHEVKALIEQKGFNHVDVKAKVTYKMIGEVITPFADTIDYLISWGDGHSMRKTFKCLEYGRLTTRVMYYANQAVLDKCATLTAKGSSSSLVDAESCLLFSKPRLRKKRKKMLCNSAVG